MSENNATNGKVRPHISFTFKDGYDGKPSDKPFDELGEYDLGIGRFQRGINQDYGEYSSSDEPDERPPDRPYTKQLPG